MKEKVLNNLLPLLLLTKTAGKAKKLRQTKTIEGMKVEW